MSAEPTARELMARRYAPRHRVTNCLQHAGLSIADRPDECKLCRADLRDAYAWLVDRHEWLNRWRDDALTVLTRQDAALAALAAYELRDAASHRGSLGFADLVRPTPSGGYETVAADVPPDVRDAIEKLLRLAEAADGIIDVPTADPERST